MKQISLKKFWGRMSLAMFGLVLISSTIISTHVFTLAATVVSPDADFWIIPPSVEADDIDPIEYAAAIWRDNQVGLVSYDGVIVVDAKYTSIWPTSRDGLCEASKMGDFCLDADIYDSNFNIVAFEYGHGLERFYFYFDPINNRVLSELFDEFIPFETSHANDDFMPVSVILVDGKPMNPELVDDHSLENVQTRFGFINREGKVVIQPIYEAVGEFSEGLCPVRYGNLWGFVDTRGKEVIPPQLEPTIYKDYEFWVDEWMFGFSEGVTPLKKDGLWGYMDKTGKVVIPPMFEATRPVYQGKAWAKSNGLWGVVDMGRLFSAVSSRIDNGNTDDKKDNSTKESDESSETKEEPTSSPEVSPSQTPDEDTEQESETSGDTSDNETDQNQKTADDEGGFKSIYMIPMGIMAIGVMVVGIVFAARRRG